MRVSTLDAVTGEKNWNELVAFIRRYGRDLFHPRFLALGNLRGVYHRGVGAYLDYLQEEAGSGDVVSLLEDLNRSIAREDAERLLQIILQTLIENYDHYRDFNATTPQSDYGENLFQLFEFLRLKASYDRNAWLLRPLILVHEVLVRRHEAAAGLWREQVQHITHKTAEEHLVQLSRLEQKHGLRLTTIADRLEERFIKPLAIDRLCALIEPALDQARRGDSDQEEVPLEKELKDLAAQPAGVGLDVPDWLLRLEGELQRVRTVRTSLVSLAETLFQIPKISVSFVDLAGQVKDWDRWIKAE
jgi:hypothetical protein